MVILDRALFFRGDSHRLLVLDSRTSPPESGGLLSFRLKSSGELKVVLVWSDEASSSIAVTNLVNDLDLVLEGDPVVYRGNVFADGHSIEGGSCDRLNNVEVILLEDAPPGWWTLRVMPHRILAPPQPYAVVVIGDVEERPLARDAGGAGRS